MRRIFELLLEEGVRTVDFGFGDSEYKRFHGTHHRDERTLELYGKGSRVNRAWLSATGADRLHGLARGLASRGGALESLRKRWRGRLEGRAGKERP